MKILVGLSGGVDSSVTAALLKSQGHEVIGITMSIWDGPEQKIEGKNACYGPDEKEDLEEAARIAEILKIPHHVVPLVDDYENVVLEHFRSEYARGRTPNPCILCNARIKFGALLHAAAGSSLPFDKFATGHYARIRMGDHDGPPLLYEAVDKKKDQTYFLHRLQSDQLSRILFPLGDYTKEEVRAMAREWGLPVHDKDDSKGFYAGDYRELLDFEAQEGPIVDRAGKQLGTHKGIWNFTIGQRKGLNLDLPQGTSLFVIHLDQKNNRVVVGGKEDLYRKEFTATMPYWISGTPELPLHADIKISNTHPKVMGKVSAEEGGMVRILYNEPQVAIAPGQFAVFYQEERVLGGAVIEQVF